MENNMINLPNTITKLIPNASAIVTTTFTSIFTSTFITMFNKIFKNMPVKPMILSGILGIVGGFILPRHVIRKSKDHDFIFSIIISSISTGCFWLKLNNHKFTNHIIFLLAFLLMYLSFDSIMRYVTKKKLFKKK